MACSRANFAFYLYLYRRCSKQHRILWDLLRRCVCVCVCVCVYSGTGCDGRVLIADNEWTARRYCCCCYLDVKPGGSGDGRCRYRTTFNIFFWQTLQTIQTTDRRTKMHHCPLDTTFTAVTWSKNETDTRLAVTWPPNKYASSMFYYYAYSCCFNIHTHHSRRACHLLRGHGLYDYDLF